MRQTEDPIQGPTEDPLYGCMDFYSTYGHSLISIISICVAGDPMIEKKNNDENGFLYLLPT